MEIRFNGTGEELERFLTRNFDNPVYIFGIGIALTRSAWFEVVDQVETGHGEVFVEVKIDESGDWVAILENPEFTYEEVMGRV